MTATVDEVARLDALSALQVPLAEPEERFDRITRLAKQHFGVAVATVSLIDRPPPHSTTTCSRPAPW